MKPDGTSRLGASGRGQTVLCVDDSRTCLALLGERLNQLGYLVLLAENGADALDQISSRAPDLVLLDTDMPGLSGLHVLQEVRGARDTADLPVIMLSARAEPSDVVEALAAGADDHVGKPGTLEVLAARMERVLARAARVAELKRAALALDARIATRAIELGEAQAELAELRADRARLVGSIRGLHDEVERLSARR